jgi:cytochrome d ubiquinol oxidase subunit II
LVPLATFISIAFIPYFIMRRKDFIAFVCSSVTIVGLFTLFGVGTFPVMVRATNQSAINSMNYMDYSASTMTLEIFLTIVAIGVPLVLSYMFWIYKVFHGKVKMDHRSY